MIRDQMLHCAMFLATSLAIWSGNWLLNRNIARQVARGMLNCANAKNALQRCDNYCEKLFYLV